VKQRIVNLKNSQRERLNAAGCDYLPGGGVEIISGRIRKETTATVMFWHVGANERRARGVSFPDT